MDYEKKYKEEIIRATQLWECGDITRENLEYIFPELKESEDEKWRNWLIGHLKGYINQTNDKYAKVCKEVIAWLEKQSEQKPADTVKPKFNVGDWVVDRNGNVQQILSYKDCIYKHTNGYSSKMFEDEWRMWNVVKDAKDGDVLATDDGNIFVFDGTVEDDKYPFAYYGLTRRRFETYDRRLPFTHNNVHPATKEQRDLLFQKMEEAGFKWDDDNDNKELKKVEQTPTWSEEDEHRAKDTIYFLDTAKKHYASTVELDACIDWLKSIKERVHTQSTWKPSEEQIKAIRLARSFVVDDFGEHPTLSEMLIELEEQLKKLKGE